MVSFSSTDETKPIEGGCETTHHGPALSESCNDNNVIDFLWYLMYKRYCKVFDGMSLRID